MSITERVTEMVPQLLIGGVVSLLGLAVTFLVVNAFGEKQRFMQRIGMMCAGLFGVALGTGALVVGEIVISPDGGGAAADVTAGEPSPEEARKQFDGGGGMMGGGGGMMGGGGGMMRGMGGGGGMMGGRGGNRESGKRDLTTLVRKLELLTGDVSVKLTEDQVASVAKKLVAVGGEKSLTEEQAKAAHEGLVEILTESQRGQLEKVSLPRRRGGRARVLHAGPRFRTGRPAARHYQRPTKTLHDRRYRVGARARLPDPAGEFVPRFFRVRRLVDAP